MDTVVFPDREALHEEYNLHFSSRSMVVHALETRIEEFIDVLPSHPRIKGRVKTFESFFRKCIRLLKDDLPVSGGNENHGSASGGQKQAEAIFSHITDMIGLRIICPFLEDLAVVEELLKEKFNVIEVERKGGDHTYREFGYESIHVLIAIPEDILEKIPADIQKKMKLYCDNIAEIQIRTILQHAWAEVEHELVYKAEFSPFDNPMKRKLAAVNATLSLADIIFQEVRSYQRELNGELGKRRDSFFKKIEESTDAVLFMDEKSLADTDPSLLEESSAQVLPDSTIPVPNVSIDDLLLNALYAHNKNQISKAIAMYTQILELEVDVTISSLIYKHRGMAYFARSHYKEAIADFSKSLELDPKSYKSAYYKGVVCSVLQNYSEAVDAFNLALEINPYQPYCLYRRGQAYYHLEDYPQALGDCEAALALESFEAARKLKDLLLAKLKM
ncbi:MAG: tetratricopeptide repeat protein [Treponema sp.]|nr:tetratricopeptide repeat protein [Treponema sp.]